ncbi:MAG: 4-(cytidine 5'-diphospho)-2-C-methyl-D-erythritol kinase [Terriglobales bacterium]
MRTSSSATVAVRSFAKINLGLYIGAARVDGYHDLRTVYQTIALYDAIRVSVERNSGRSSGIEIRCDDPRVPLNSSNTCHRMAERVMDELGAKGRVTVQIEKRLPVQGGLGAASSNGVATMIGLERALKKKLSGPARLRIAAEIGSDLPLFLVGGTALGVGHGEEVYSLPDLPAMAMVVVMPEVGVSTAQAFADWDALVQREKAAEPRSAGPFDSAPGRLPGAAVPTRTGTGQSPVTTRAWTGGDARRSIANRQLTRPLASDRLFEVGCALSAWLCSLTSGYPNTGAPAKGGSRAGNLLSDLVRTGIENDFEKVVFPKYPELRDIKGELERAGSRYASLSGSGSTLYGLFRSPADAAQAASRLRKRGLKAVTTSTLTRQEYWKRILD